MALSSSSSSSSSSSESSYDEAPVLLFLAGLIDDATSPPPAPQVRAGLASAPARAVRIPESRKRRQRYPDREGNASMRMSAYHTCVWDDFLQLREMSGEERGESVLHNNFRRTFRVPWEVAEEILGDLKTDEHTRTWAKIPRIGQKGQRPLPLYRKLWATLRTLALGAPINAMSDIVLISESVLQHFFHAFVEWGTLTYGWRIQAPRDTAGIARAEHVYRQLGLPGCCSSTDGVHVAWMRAPSVLSHLYVGKEGFPKAASPLPVSPRLSPRACLPVPVSRAGLPAQTCSQYLQHVDIPDST